MQFRKFQTCLICSLSLGLPKRFLMGYPILNKSTVLIQFDRYESINQRFNIMLFNLYSTFFLFLFGVCVYFHVKQYGFEKQTFLLHITILSKFLTHPKFARSSHHL